MTIITDRSSFVDESWVIIVQHWLSTTWTKCCLHFLWRSLDVRAQQEPNGIQTQSQKEGRDWSAGHRQEACPRSSAGSTTLLCRGRSRENSVGGACRRWRGGRPPLWGMGSSEWWAGSGGEKKYGWSSACGRHQPSVNKMRCVQTNSPRAKENIWHLGSFDRLC